MSSKAIQVEEIPLEVPENSTLEITSNNITYFTHGFFKYPCKFIPQVPRWAIDKYSNDVSIILDPFAGSGTTLVEAALQGKKAIGVDFDKLSQLLCKTKTKSLSEKQLGLIESFTARVFAPRKKKTGVLPDLHNLYHWFPEKNVVDLQHLKLSIEEFYKSSSDEGVYNFLLVAFASIIRKCSYADAVSPKPYVSTKIQKNPLEVENAFERTVLTNLKSVKTYQVNSLGEVEIISDDARNITSSKYNGKVSLAVTSPPYINAFDYVRSLRLENAWLGFYGDSNIVDIKRKQIGTETIPHEEYSKKPKKVKVEALAKLTDKISRTDRKRAHAIHKFFEDMEKNIRQVNKLLQRDGHYVVVVGNSTIRGEPIPTHQILTELALMNGFKLDNVFSYVIKNRYLRIPRMDKGGFIKKDWIIDLVKVDG